MRQRKESVKAPRARKNKKAIDNYNSDDIIVFVAQLIRCICVCSSAG